MAPSASSVSFEQKEDAGGHFGKQDGSPRVRLDGVWSLEYACLLVGKNVTR